MESSLKSEILAVDSLDFDIENLQYFIEKKSANFDIRKGNILVDDGSSGMLFPYMKMLFPSRMSMQVTKENHFSFFVEFSSKLI